MNNFHLFDILPLWATFICIIILILFSAWSGVSFARWRKKRIQEEEGPLNTVVGANLALLAFILAFTFGLTTTRFDERKSYLLEDVNAIETAWLRADLIGEPQSSEAKELLKEYVKLRITIAKNPENALKIIAQSNIIQRQIWSIVKELAHDSSPNNTINALFIKSVNEVFDNQTKRVTVTLSHRIPAMIWAALFVLIMFSMFAVGYLFGKMKETNWYMILALSLAFAAVLLVIVDLDGTRGTIQIDHTPMYNLFQRILDGS